MKNANKENYHNSITQTTRKFEGYVFLIFKNIAGIFSFIIRYESQTMLSFVEELKKKKRIKSLVLDLPRFSDAGMS